MAVKAGALKADLWGESSTLVWQARGVLNPYASSNRFTDVLVSVGSRYCEQASVANNADNFIPLYADGHWFTFTFSIRVRVSV